MTDKNFKKPRVNISITGDDALAIEALRIKLERRLKQRLSIAQIIKRMTKECNIAEDLMADTDSQNS